jgi:predicted secreted acid phosphatase
MEWMNGMKLSLSLCVTSLALCATAALAVPANQITIPQDPHFDSAAGLKYTETPEYRAEISSLVKRAREECQPFVGQDKVAIVFDIDETLLDNREEFRLRQERNFDAFWNEGSWDKWVRESRAPQIKETADLARWAKNNHFAVFMITGRLATQQAATEANLIKEQIPFDEVFTKPLNYRGPAEDAKTDSRRIIESRGYKIICSIGDQESDLYGLHSIYCEKMPNKMYFVP